MTIAIEMSENQRHRTMLCAGLSGFFEVGASHPLDYIKTCMQRKSPVDWRNCYKGVTSRWCSVIPMRGVLWTVKREGATMKAGLMQKCGVLGATAGIGQTLFDLPMENVKTQLMMDRGKGSVVYSPQRLTRGCVPNALRNCVLCTCILGGVYSGGGTLPHLFAGSVLGCVLSHPFDWAKTIVQSDGCLRTSDVRKCMTGVVPRAMITPMNILVSFTVFQWFDAGK